MTSWRSLLDDYAAVVAAAEATVAGGTQADAPPPFAPPTLPPDAPPTPADLARLVELRARAEDCSAELRRLVRDAADELDALRRTRQAGGAYRGRPSVP